MVKVGVGEGGAPCEQTLIVEPLTAQEWVLLKAERGVPLALCPIWEI